MYPFNGGVNYFGSGTMQRQTPQQPQGGLLSPQPQGIPYSSFNSAPGSGVAPQQMMNPGGMNPSRGMPVGGMGSPFGQISSIPYASFNSAPGSGVAPQQMMNPGGMNPSAHPMLPGGGDVYASATGGYANGPSPQFQNPYMQTQQNPFAQNMMGGQYSQINSLGGYNQASGSQPYWQQYLGGGFGQ